MSIVHLKVGSLTDVCYSYTSLKADLVSFVCFQQSVDLAHLNLSAEEWGKKYGKSGMDAEFINKAH